MPYNPIEPPDFSSVLTSQLLKELIEYVLMNEKSEHSYYFEIEHRVDEISKRIDKKES